MLRMNPPRFNQLEPKNSNFDRVKPKSPCFSITPKGIKVTGTDCQGLFTDLTQENDFTLEKHGIGTSYRRVSLSDLDYQMWLKKLGEGLSSYLRNNEKLEIDKESVTLEDFPDGYVLLSHSRCYKGRASLRSDKVLYGHHFYKSPQEFLPHLIWLVTNKTLICRCKHCAAEYTGIERRARASSKPGSPTSLSQVVSSQTPAKRKRTHSNFVLDKLSQNDHKIYTLYRCGEVVWIDLEKIEIKKLELLKDDSVSHGVTIRYWPGIIMERKKAPILDSCRDPVSATSTTAGSSASSSTSGDSLTRFKVIYCVQLVGLCDLVITDRLKMAPWVAYDPNIDTQNVSSSDKPSVHQLYAQAIQRVKIISKSCTPLNPYRHIEHSNKIRKIRSLKEKARLRKMSQFPHYKAIIIGSEVVCLEDIVRLTPIEKTEQSIEPDPKFLFVTSIYEDPNRGIQFTGDGLCKGDLCSTNRKRKISDYDWNPINTKNEEFTIDLEDIAGRFYVSYPNISVTMEADTPTTLQDRYNTLGIACDDNLTLDVSPTI
ncbi:146_t:CDS:2 [Acaulospora morrowiae]|uniref:146_t:CDS:1 n=1 Tax=Acaulospora morrowiae TaxID=94023 RepID=A0A9N8YS44_9GLOM|nr:146_t:CDS:2 [Acaulospora morrowiae]